jgi:hypothetical protein
MSWTRRRKLSGLGTQFFIDVAVYRSALIPGYRDDNRRPDRPPRRLIAEFNLGFILIAPKSRSPVSNRT